MAAIVAPGVCRFALNGTYAGQPVVNIVDMQIDTTGSTEGRGDACFGQAGVLINEFAGSMTANLSNRYEFVSVSWVDLDSLSGTTGERTRTDTVTLPVNGGQSSAPAPGNVAFRVAKNTVPTRGLRQGRMYLAGVPESSTDATDPNTVVNTVAATINADLVAFLNGINQDDGGITGYTSQMVVVHTVEGVFESWTEVTGLVLESRVGSQRRRLDL